MTDHSEAVPLTKTNCFLPESHFSIQSTTFPLAPSARNLKCFHGELRQMLSGNLTKGHLQLCLSNSPGLWHERTCGIVSL